jgi:hypothetical protein
MTVKEDESMWEREKRENADRADRQLALQERQVALQEAEVKRVAALQERHAVSMEAMVERPVYGDGPGERLNAFFALPREQQDFRLREACVSYASRFSRDANEAIANAGQLLAYIRGEE